MRGEYYLRPTENMRDLSREKAASSSACIRSMPTQKGRPWQ